MKQGFSLVEMLVVVAIVMVLAGLLLPAVVSSRREGYKASDIERMHQIAVAGILYSNDYSEFPTRVEQLVELGMIDKGLCRLAMDPYPQGMENYFLTGPNEPGFLARTAPAYPESLITPGDFGTRRTFASEIIRYSNPGWAISATQGIPNTSGSRFWGPRYQRVGDDGSVTTRPLPERNEIHQGRTVQAVHFVDFFCDRKQ